MNNILNEVKWDKNGLVSVIAQDIHSKKVRMLAYMNEEALTKTLESGRVHYYSRSRSELWLKGETSGHFQYLKSISIDCDGDALLMQIEQVGNVSCHTGNHTCFYRNYEDHKWIKKEKESIPKTLDTKERSMVNYIYDVIAHRKQNPKEGSYTNYLMHEGIDKILKKFGEEATEVILAAKNNDDKELIFEMADLLFHMSVIMVETNITWDDINLELSKRK